MCNLLQMQMCKIFWLFKHYLFFFQCGSSIDVISCNMDACKHFITPQNCNQMLHKTRK